MLVLTDYADPCDSPNGWHLVAKKCYKYFSEPENWADARQGCLDEGADMLTVNNADELSLVSESVACDSKAPVWLGFSDVSKPV